MASSQLDSPGAKEVLKMVIEKYPQSSRAGCALMYLAQRSKGPEQENYLKEAIKNHSDCFYGDGVQVGAYARLYLADYYLQTGKTDEAKALQEQIRKDYPDAIDHGGKPLSEQLTKGRVQYRQRFARDLNIYTPEQLREAEGLYRKANQQWQKPEGKAALKELIEKYPQANLTGCALVYFGEKTPGPEGENYLKEAIQNHSDCIYGNGVQVGAYARFRLAEYYLKTGKPEEAKALQEQIRKDYPDAVDHNGKPLSPQSK